MVDQLNERIRQIAYQLEFYHFLTESMRVRLQAELSELIQKRNRVAEMLPERR